MSQGKLPGDALSIEQLETGLIVLDEGMLDDDAFWDENMTAFRETVLVAIGETSITLAVEVWVLRQGQGDRIKVTDAEFKFVALNDNGCPRPVLA